MQYTIGDYVARNRWFIVYVLAAVIIANGYNYRCIFIFMVGDSLEVVLEFSGRGQVAIKWKSDLADRLPNNGLVDTNIYDRKIL